MDTNFLMIEGIPFPGKTYNRDDIISIRDEFVVKDEDTIVLSYPKSGTNWMIEIVGLIHCKGNPTWTHSVLSWERSPWLESIGGYRYVKNNRNDVHFYTSHLPIQLFPKSFFNSKAKVIYLIRNPRDVLTSGFHFFKAVQYIKSPETFDQYFECFLQGNVIYGSWFDHIRDWLQMQGKENFLVIFYEELKQNTASTVEKISQFLGKQLGPEELNSVLKNMSFEVMSSNKMANFSILPEDILDHSKGQLMRKGVTGDWKCHFTVAQNEAFDKVYQEKMANFPPGSFPWEK
ncbi:PREDICTED: bile salt sulfotransferase-like [Elephantulus edwardii]|uniref:bile salt sulfotransferase-like n=1 Tax=Elephantulus edwardii TaxID=28737 RepID=UPI0003F06A50|nr:PREDICTED: bile salt sulfotransferase-like [Elephantulus edwardii]